MKTIQLEGLEFSGYDEQDYIDAGHKLGLECAPIVMFRMSPTNPRHSSINMKRGCPACIHARAYQIYSDYVDHDDEAAAELKATEIVEQMIKEHNKGIS